MKAIKDSDLSELTENFKDKGYVVLKNLISLKLIEQCDKLYDQLQRVEPVEWTFGGIFEHDSELALALVANIDVLSFLETIFGPFVQLDSLALVGIPPIEAGYDKRIVSGWHRDPWASIPINAEYQRPMAVNGLVYLQDLTHDSGPLRIIPGSHKLSLKIPYEKRRESHAAEVLLFPCAGDYVIVHNALIHTGTPPNTLSQERRFASIFYNLSWLRSTTLYTSDVELDLLKQFRSQNDRRMLRLFGEDDLLKTRTDTGFLDNDEESWQQWLEEDRLALKY